MGFKFPVRPHFPSEPTLIRNRASYRKQSSCLMTSSLNPWGEMGVTSACGIGSVFFRHPNKSQEKHPVMTPVSREDNWKRWVWLSLHLPCEDTSAVCRLSVLDRYVRLNRCKRVFPERKTKMFSNVHGIVNAILYILIDI